MPYIIITPVKNEDQFVWQTIKSITEQTKHPVLWVFADGGSTDRTKEIITAYSREYDFIKLIKCTTVGRTTHETVSLAVREAALFAQQYCTANQISFDYVWTIDADQILENTVCEGVINEMHKDPSVGAASGQVYEPDGKLDIYPSGELPNKRVYRKEALFSIGGIPVTKYSYDSVILAKLRIAGWKIQAYPEYGIQNLRSDSGIERNNWRSHVQFGYSRYYLGYSLPLVVAGTGYLLMQLKVLKAIGIFYGYITSRVKRDEHIADFEVWDHFRNNRLREVLKGGI